MLRASTSAISPARRARAAPRRPRGGALRRYATVDVGGVSVDTEDVVQAVTQAAGVGVEAAKVGAQAAKKGVEVIAPVVERVARDTLLPAAEKAGSQLSDSLSAAGVDTSVVDSVRSAGAPVVEVLGGALRGGVEELAPAAGEALRAGVDVAVTTPEKALIAGAAALLLLQLLPSFGASAASALRGYRGDLSPADALKMVCQGSAVLVDVRTETEKISSGVPDLPGSARSALVSMANDAIADRALRGQLRDAARIEAEIAALKISSLKRLSRGTNVIVMDARGQGEARNIAKKLSDLGFSSTFIVAGGFSGRGGWTASKLGSQNYFRGSNRIPFFSTEVVDGGGGGTRRALPGGRK